ncbi:hypothetical protein, partial [Cohnella sp. GbtcB17]|uniref:hypothetical protein n=1 Tax=Cohnella sp. GbtcB17 TaxID=2824762 RepID=UPI001C30DB55
CADERAAGPLKVGEKIEVLDIPAHAQVPPLGKSGKPHHAGFVDAEFANGDNGRAKGQHENE